MDSLIYVKFKRNLLKADLEKQILEVMDARIRSLPNFLELRLNPELILLCCNLIENGVSDKKLKITKKDLCIRVLNNLFNYNAQDKKQVEDTIEFLHANDKIQKVKISEKVFHLFIDWIKRKVL